MVEHGGLLALLDGPPATNDVENLGRMVGLPDLRAPAILDRVARAHADRVERVRLRSGDRDARGKPRRRAVAAAREASIVVAAIALRLGGVFLGLTHLLHESEHGHEA